MHRTDRHDGKKHDADRDVREHLGRNAPALQMSLAGANRVRRHVQVFVLLLRSTMATS